MLRSTFYGSIVGPHMRCQSTTRQSSIVFRAHSSDQKTLEVQSLTSFLRFLFTTTSRIFPDLCNPPTCVKNFTVGPRLHTVNMKPVATQTRACRHFAMKNQSYRLRHNLSKSLVLHLLIPSSRVRSA